MIAPATANTIAKLATGLADDLLGNTVLASEAPVVIAPAMHTEMWQNPATRANIATLRVARRHVVGPAVGQLTGADSGPGRMEEPDVIVEAALARRRRHPAVRRPRRSPRGRHRRRHARAARPGALPRQPLERQAGRRDRRGRRARAAPQVTLDRREPRGRPTRPAATSAGSSTALELQAGGDGCRARRRRRRHGRRGRRLPARRRQRGEDQEGRRATTGSTLELVSNPDILAGLGHAPHDGTAARRLRRRDRARRRRACSSSGRPSARRKGADLLVVNRVGWTRDSPRDENAVVVIGRDGDIVTEPHGSKTSVADRILDVVCLGDRRPRRSAADDLDRNTRPPHERPPPLHLRIRHRGAPRQDLRPGLRLDPRRPAHRRPAQPGRRRDARHDGPRARRRRGDHVGLRRDPGDRARTDHRRSATTRPTSGSTAARAASPSRSAASRPTSPRASTTPSRRASAPASTRSTGRAPATRASCSATPRARRPSSCRCRSGSRTASPSGSPRCASRASSTTCAPTARPRSRSATTGSAAHRSRPSCSRPSTRRPCRPSSSAPRSRSSSSARCSTRVDLARPEPQRCSSTPPAGSRSAARRATPASPDARSSSTPTAARAGTAAARSAARTRRRSTGRPPTRCAGSRRTPSPPGSPTVSSCRSPTRSARRRPSGSTSRRSAPAHVPDERIIGAIREVFDLRPAAIIRDLDLLRPDLRADGDLRPLRPRAARLHLGAARPRRRPPRRRRALTWRAAPSPGCSSIRRCRSSTSSSTTRFPSASRERSVPGVRVRVPLRTGGRIAAGWLVELADTSEYRRRAQRARGRRLRGAAC